MIAIATLLAGTVIGAAGHAAFSASAPEGRRSVDARLSLRGISLDGGPTVHLALEIANDRSAAVSVKGLRLHGAGLDGHDLRTQLVVPAGDRVLTEFTTGVSCPSRQFSPPGLSARLDLRTGADVPVTVTEPLGTFGGLCAAVFAALPSGWTQPVRVVSARLAGTGAVSGAGELTGLDLVLDIGTPGTQLLSIALDGRPLTLAAGFPRQVVGGLEILLPPPALHCADLSHRDRLPTGVQLTVRAPGGDLALRYAPVGTLLSAWLLTGLDDACGIAPHKSTGSGTSASPASPHPTALG